PRSRRHGSGRITGTSPLPLQPGRPDGRPDILTGAAGKSRRHDAGRTGTTPAWPRRPPSPGPCPGTHLPGHPATAVLTPLTRPASPPAPPSSPRARAVILTINTQEPRHGYRGT